MSSSKLLSQATEAFWQNKRSILLFSIPFLLAFPLVLLLPNYAAFGAIFLRPGSIGSDVALPQLLLMLAVAVLSLLLFSFAVVAVNSIVKSQRTFNRLKHMDFERMETATLRMFVVYAVSFISVFAFSLLLFQTHAVEEKTRLALTALFSLAVYLLTLFAPQAVVIDNLGADSALSVSAKTVFAKFSSVIFFALVALVLATVNAAIFLFLQDYFFWAPLLGVLANSLFILPFLEVFKVQIYLSKYSLL